MSVNSERYYEHKGFNDIVDAANILNARPPKEIKEGKEFVDGWHNNGIRGSKEDEWKHCGKKEGYKTYVDGINPDDIKQGAAGSCYFLAALGAVAEDPTYIKDMIIENMDQRCYGIKLFNWGRPVIQWVDDKFPMKNGKPLFTSCGEKKESWAMLVEKAYAKINGSYNKIEGGWPGDALSDLTGCPSVCVDTFYTRNSKVWEQMTKVTGERGTSITSASIGYSPLWFYFSFGLIRHLFWVCRFIFYITAPIPYLGSLVRMIYWCLHTMYALYTWVWFGLNLITFGILNLLYAGLCIVTVGLCPMHAYSVLEVKGTACTKLVKVRNPHASYEYRGWYSDNSLCWKLRPGLAKELNIIKEDDGSFWMHLSDFCTYFDKIYTCYLLPEMKALRIQGKVTELETSIPFSINEETELCVQINQIRVGQDNASNMLTWRLRLVEDTGSKVTWKDPGLVKNYASRDYQHDCQLATGFITLKPGRYVVLIDCPPADQKDLNRSGGVKATVCIHSKFCQRIQFENENMKRCQPTEVRQFVRGCKV